MQPVMQGFDYAAQRSMYRPGTGCMRMWHCKERDGLFASGNEVYYIILRYIPSKNYDFNTENDNNPLELGDEITYVVSDKSIRVSFFAGRVHLVNLVI